VTGGNDLAELKQHVVVHARGQKMAPEHYRAVLAAIRDDGEGPGSWTAEWVAAGDRLEREGRLLEAGRHYAMARFPFVDGPGRRAAHERAVAVFDRWRQGVPGLERLDVPLPDGTARCWIGGTSTTSPRPLLLIMGGIVTIKEQWAPMLARADQLSLAGVVAELPGVGENTLRYDRDSPRMLSSILDALADRADVSRTYALAMSFSGHLALRAAADDPRIRGVVTTGAPISGFFTDTDWQQRVPRITTDTLAHLTDAEPAKVYAEIHDWALSAETMAGLRIPVHYAASRRDEIIPPGETGLLRRHLRDLHLIEKDDGHGSPRYADEISLWALSSVLGMVGSRAVPRAVLGASRWALRARRRLRPAL
jgi:esterase FrsA